MHNFSYLDDALIDEDVSNVNAILADRKDNQTMKPIKNMQLKESTYVSEQL